MADPKQTHSPNTLISLRIKFYFCSLLTTMLCKQTIFLWVGWRCYPPTLLSSLSLSFRKEEKDESIFSSTNFSHRNRFEQIYSFFISLSLSISPAPFGVYNELRVAPHESNHVDVLDSQMILFWLNYSGSVYRNNKHELCFYDCSNRSVTYLDEYGSSD